MLNEINRSNLRLDQIIEAVKKIVKNDAKNVKRKEYSSTPDKLQPKKLKDRVEKLLTQNNQPATKYLK